MLAYIAGIKQWNKHTVAWHKVTETEKMHLYTEIHDTFLFLHLSSISVHLGLGREGSPFTCLPYTKVAPSLSHSGRPIPTDLVHART